MLKQILSISGKPGLYKLISRGKNMLIVESLVDHKRITAYTRDRLVSLSDVSMFTTGEDVALSDVLQKMGEKYSWKPVDMDVKNADNDALRAFFAEVIENFDRDRVYPTDIRKLILWYNILINAGFTDFTPQNEEEGESSEQQVKTETVAENKKEKKKSVNTSVKTQKAAPKTAAKTGVGAKKG